MGSTARVCENLKMYRERRNVRPPRGAKPGLLANAAKKKDGKYVYVPRSIAASGGVCGVRQSDGKYAKGCGGVLVNGECPTCATDKAHARSNTGASLADRVAVQMTGAEITTHPLDGKLSAPASRELTRNQYHGAINAAKRKDAKPCGVPKANADGVEALDKALAYLKRAPEAGPRVTPPPVERVPPRDTGTPIDAATFARATGNVAMF